MEASMYISSVPPNPAAIRAVATPWLHRLLDDPRMCGTVAPEQVRGYLYIQETPRQIAYGTWQVGVDAIYLPRAGNDPIVHPLTKLAIISAIAAMTGATSDPELVTKITTKLVVLLKEEAIGTYANIVRSYHKPSRLAIDQENYQIAAEMDGRWLLPSGAPTEVGENWITMDF
jgi:hypothetical protein